MLELNFTNHEIAQDMIRLIQKEKGLTESQCISLAVNSKTCKQIIDTGWASIALSMWGHDNPEREWLLLDNPIVDVELENDKEQLIEKISSKENVDIETAVSYFLLFTMEALGYHI